MKSYFTLEEFQCTCCGKADMSIVLVEILNNIRHELGKPIFISSGYRCKEYNEAVGGVWDSAHTNGEAVDISTANSSYRYAIIGLALKHGIKRIGVGGMFTHVDIDKTKPQ
ncbi:MAG: D-Ala-D-Ala carboxypeptidase family metallohydrolase, partial [Planctomycetota bacterium]